MAPILGGNQGWCKSMVMLRGFSVSDWCIVWVGRLMTPVGQTHGLFGGHVDIGWGCIGKIKELPKFCEIIPVFFGVFGQPQPGWSIQFSGRHDLQLFSSLCFFGHWSPHRRQNVDFMFRDPPEFLTGVLQEDRTFTDSSNPQKGVKDLDFQWFSTDDI